MQPRSGCTASSTHHHGASTRSSAGREKPKPQPSLLTTAWTSYNGGRSRIRANGLSFHVLDNVMLEGFYC